MTRHWNAHLGVSLFQTSHLRSHNILSFKCKKERTVASSQCVALILHTAVKPKPVPRGTFKIREKSTIAINKAVVRPRHEQEVPFPTSVLQEVEYKISRQRDITKLVFYARNKSSLCLSSKMEKKLSTDSIASYITIVSIKEKRRSILNKGQCCTRTNKYKLTMNKFDLGIRKGF